MNSRMPAGYGRWRNESSLTLRSPERSETRIRQAETASADVPDSTPTIKRGGAPIQRRGLRVGVGMNPYIAVDDGE